jgi:hypothetical protein
LNLSSAHWIDNGVAKCLINIWTTIKPHDAVGVKVLPLHTYDGTLALLKSISNGLPSNVEKRNAQTQCTSTSACEYYVWTHDGYTFEYHNRRLCMTITGIAFITRADFILYVVDYMFHNGFTRTYQHNIRYRDDRLNTSLWLIVYSMIRRKRIPYGPSADWSEYSHGIDVPGYQVYSENGEYMIDSGANEMAPYLQTSEKEDELLRRIRVKIGLW